MGFNKGSYKYTRSYSNILGVDRSGSGSEISDRRLSYSENMYRDYDADGGGVIESIPGYRKIFSLKKRINGIYIQKGTECDYLVIHAGDEVYRVRVDGRDSDEPFKIGEMSDGKSRAFSYMGELYLLDGVKIYVVNKDGIMKALRRNDPSTYIPTTYVGGEKYEMRNLFTDRFYEEMPIPDPYVFSYETEGLIYDILDEGLGLCTVSGSKEEIIGNLHIPKYKDICGVRYKVYSIREEAFKGQSGITSLRISSGPSLIGKRAFSGCTSISAIYVPQSVTDIGDEAFDGCSMLKNVHIGLGCKKIGENAFRGCSKLGNVYYGGERDEFLKIEGVGALANAYLEILCPDRSLKLRVPIFSDVESIISVTLNNRLINCTQEVKDDMSYVVIEWDNSTELSDRLLRISGVLRPYKSYFRAGTPKDPYELDDSGYDGFDTICSATVAEIFDGRIFFAGCKNLPGAVFYSERTKEGYNDPLYVGVYDYFRDGGYETASLLAVRDKLAHFKKGDGGDGGVFYHYPMETGDTLMPKAYPVSSVHKGIFALGDSISFYDDPVFLSKQGLSALRMANIDYERSVECVSHNVNFDLLTENLSESSLFEWQGYLGIAVGGRVYLADSRAKFKHETGDLEYEWFIINGVGGWSSDHRVYRYSSAPRDGYSIGKHPDDEALGVVYSESDDVGIVYYTKEDGVKYEVYPTDEMKGGDFHPATTFASADGILFFGTDTGDVFVFNNDKRGVAPERISSSEDFSYDEYKASMGRYIHPDYYSFAGHAPRYAIKTKRDNCGIPYMAKDTVKNTLTLRCRGTAGSDVHVEVGTDRAGYCEIAHFPTHSIDFSDLSFADISLDTGIYISVPFRERERGWNEKEITVYSDSPASPIAISSISYRYTVSGKIKKR